MDSKLIIRILWKFWCFCSLPCGILWVLTIFQNIKDLTRFSRLSVLFQYPTSVSLLSIFLLNNLRIKYTLLNISCVWRGTQHQRRVERKVLHTVHTKLIPGAKRYLPILPEKIWTSLYFFVVLLHCRWLALMTSHFRFPPHLCRKSPHYVHSCSGLVKRGKRQRG